jgi:cyclophilin family peptidyl-prolyl cis-trans isomerase
LVARLEDPVHHVREVAASALGEIGHPDASEPLLVASADSVVGVRRAAVAAIARLLGEDAVPSLTTRLADPSPVVAATAVSALAEVAGRDAYEILVEASESGETLVATAAAAALGTLGEPAAIGPLVDLLEARDWVVAATAAEALMQLGDEAAEAALLASLERWRGFEENRVRSVALAALGDLGGGRSLEAITRALLDPDPRVRSAAAAAADSMVSRGIDLDPELRETLTISRERDSGPQPLGDPPGEFPLTGEPRERRARIITWRGVIEIELLPALAPMAVASFVRLARSGFYDGAVFHRVVPNFVIQGGCPRHDGYGGPGYSLRGEVSPEPYGVGTVGMADAGMDTGGSQFFITHSPVPRLDGRYTVFARVVAGMATVDRIQQGDVFRVEIDPVTDDPETDQR